MQSSANAASITFQQSWSCSATAINANTPGFVEEQTDCGTYQLPSLPGALGTLTTAQTVVSAQGQTTVRSEVPVRSVTGLRNQGSFRSQFIFNDPGDRRDGEVLALTQATGDRLESGEQEKTNFGNGDLSPSQPNFGSPLSDDGSIASISVVGLAVARETFDEDFNQTTLTTTGFNQGTFTTTIEFDPASGFSTPESIRPIIIEDQSPNAPADPFVDLQRQIPSGMILGYFDSPPSGTTILAADGSERIAQPGSPIFIGDTVVNGDAREVRIVIDPNKPSTDPENVFVTVPIDSAYAFDEYVYDPNDSPPSLSQRLRNGLIWVGEQIENDNPEAIENRPLPYAGIRGDAGEIQQDFIEAYEAIGVDMGDVALNLQTGSPASVTTIVDVPEDAFTLSFSYAFMDLGASVDVMFGDLTFATLSTSEALLGESQFFSMTLEWTSHLTDLTFAIDGQSGIDFLVWDIVFDDIDLISTGDWSRQGPGDVNFALLTTPTSLAQIQAEVVSSPAPVPLPAGMPLLLGGLVAFGLIRRQRAA